MYKSSVNFLFLHFAAYGLHEATPVDSFPAVALNSLQVLCTICLLLNCSPAPSRSSSPALPLGVPKQSLFLCGPRTVPQCMPNPLPQLQFDLHYRWFLLCMPPQFFIRHNVMTAQQKAILQKTVPYLFLFQMDQIGQLLGHTQTWQTRQSCCSD